MTSVAARRTPRRLRSSAMASARRVPGHSTSRRSTKTGPRSRAATVRIARPSTRARAIAAVVSAIIAFSASERSVRGAGLVRRWLAAVLVLEDVGVHADPLGLLDGLAARGGPVAGDPH